MASMSCGTVIGGGAMREDCPEACVVEDYRELVADPEIDWVFIGSWNSQHRDQAAAALEAGML